MLKMLINANEELTAKNQKLLNQLKDKEETIEALQQSLDKYQELHNQALFGLMNLTSEYAELKIDYNKRLEEIKVLKEELKKVLKSNTAKAKELIAILKTVCQ